MSVAQRNRLQLAGSARAGYNADLHDVTAGNNFNIHSQVASASNGNYVLHPANNTALCLDVRNNGKTAGTVVIGWDCNGGANEAWGLQ